MCWGSSICYRNVDGASQATREQVSAPFDVVGERAALDLEP